MKYAEWRASPDYDPLKDSYCKHCLVPFQDGDELGRCEQTEHLTHVECTKHNP
ncbi:MAG: hypothetical protein ACREBS_02460 [Nitrososphaerales archaeon]